MKPIERERALKFARKLAEDAGKTLLRYSRRLHAGNLQVVHKGSAGLASEADLAAEALVIQRITRAFPGHHIIAEEDSHVRHLKVAGLAPDAPPTWLVDPLDGTNNFLSGLPFFAVSLALVHGPHVEVGVVHAPLLHETFWASRKGGAFLKRKVGLTSLTKRLQAPKTQRPLKDCLISTNLGSKRHNAELIRQFPEVRAFRRLGSAALELSYVAAGMLDGYWESGLQPWDVAAGGLFCQEAGVGITDLKGQAFDPFSPSVLAGRGTLHGDLLRILQPQ